MKKAKGKRKPVVKKPRIKKEKPIGRVTHYFGKIKVAVIKLASPLKKGDVIRIEGGDTSFFQKVVSMEEDHIRVASAKKGRDIGLKVKKRAREGYRVYKA